MGFDRIDIHLKIEKAMTDGVAKGAIGIQINDKKDHWPDLKEFNKASFVEGRFEYYECVISSINGGLFKP